MGEMSIVTQCPICLTQFKVNEGQLKVANGQVRCGACLHVFNAQLNSLTPSTHSQQLSPSPEEHQAEKPDFEGPAETKKEDFSRGSSLDYLSSLSKSDIPTLEISAEPITLQAPELVPKRIAYGWLFASVFAVIAIVTQIAWFNRDALYWEYPEYQPLFDQACSNIDCQISPRQSLDQIENQSMLVTPHADYEGAIVVRLIMNNLAEFQQPFPAINLEFSDLKGRIVANRTLQPSEYLDTELVDLFAMPVKQPIQISLELMSPGSRAVNYQLELLAPEQ